MQYVIITSNGFQMSGPGPTVYDTTEEAMEHMKPGDQLIPVVPTEHIIEHSGQKPTGRIGKVDLFF